MNYRIHTDAIKTNIVPPTVTPSQLAFIYANEADLLNVALFGQTAKQWREANPDLEGNMRDYATLEQLLILANLESMNAELIHLQLSPAERLQRLNESTRHSNRTSLKSLFNAPSLVLGLSTLIGEYLNRTGTPLNVF